MREKETREKETRERETRERRQEIKSVRLEDCFRLHRNQQHYNHFNLRPIMILVLPVTVKTTKSGPETSLSNAPVAGTN